MLLKTPPLVPIEVEKHNTKQRLGNVSIEFSILQHWEME